MAVVSGTICRLDVLRKICCCGSAVNAQQIELENRPRSRIEVSPTAFRTETPTLTGISWLVQRTASGRKRRLRSKWKPTRGRTISCESDEQVRLCGSVETAPPIRRRRTDRNGPAPSSGSANLQNRKRIRPSRWTRRATRGRAARS